MKQELWLPWPPTSNTMFAMRGYRRFPSQEYASWKNAALEHLFMQHPVKFEERVKIDFVLSPTKFLKNRRWDTDNRIKPLLDVLVAAQVIYDDDHKHLHPWSVDVDYEAPPGVVITLEAV